MTDITDPYLPIVGIGVLMGLWLFAVYCLNAKHLPRANLTRILILIICVLIGCIAGIAFVNFFEHDDPKYWGNEPPFTG